MPSRELESLAKAIGRNIQNRGKHPIFIKTGRPPLAIPHHGKPIKKFTKENILTILDGDLSIEEEKLLDEISKQNGPKP